MTYLSPEALARIYGPTSERIHNGPIRDIQLGERFSLVPDPKDFVTEIEIADDYTSIVWTRSVLRLRGFPPEEDYSTVEVAVDEDVCEIRPAVITLDGTKSRRPLVVGLTVQGLSRMDARQLGCRLYYTDKTGEEHVIELYRDIASEEAGIVVYFQREKGVTKNTYQLSVPGKNVGVREALARNNLEAEFYLREIPHRRTGAEPTL